MAEHQETCLHTVAKRSDTTQQETNRPNNNPKQRQNRMPTNTARNEPYLKQTNNRTTKGELLAKHRNTKPNNTTRNHQARQET